MSDANKYGQSIRVPPAAYRRLRKHASERRTTISAIIDVLTSVWESMPDDQRTEAIKATAILPQRSPRRRRRAAAAT